MPGEMSALQAIVQPTIGVLTNVGSAHQENFASKEAKCKEKLRLFYESDVIVYCMDDDTIRRCVSESTLKGELLAWSSKDDKAPMYVHIHTEGLRTEVDYTFKNHLRGQYIIPFIDSASIENSVVAATVALQLDVAPDVLAERMTRLEPVAMRLEVKEGQHGCTLINDSYNSDIKSLDIALDFMNRRPDH